MPGFNEKKRAFYAGIAITQNPLYDSFLRAVPGFDGWAPIVTRLPHIATKNISKLAIQKMARWSYKDQYKYQLKPEHTKTGIGND